MRIKITIAYDGSRYFGFQVQRSQTRTVAGELYEALKSLHIESKIIASGRTDAGVHASSQIIHIDLPPFWTDLKKLQAELERKLSGYIRIKHMVAAEDDFHARFGAKRRVYRYILTTRRPSPYACAYVSYEPSLDSDTIKKALSLIEGTHDFAYFQKRGSDVTQTVRTIYKASLYEYKGYTILRFEANSFLRSQIRMLVSFLLKINAGELNNEALKDQLALKKQYSRSLADPNGLYLAKIFYR